ncbi:hypothetical protein EC844_1412 [Acinetobacter calcoaceticus]|uniref:Poly alpha-glucosyltransferase n=1 Tax=Acinetobacter calcoaceticus TaxID=471 RepID=A0A4R1XDX1_ACICA|nr:hypothetical protein EC844_1412 [Acinetobacter calcoaceticus]
MTIKSYGELLILKEKLVSWLNKITIEKNINQDRYTVFLSYGNLNQRCKVWSTSDEKLETVTKRLLNFVDKTYQADKTMLNLVKIDVAYNINKKNWKDLVQIVNEQPHNNHFRQSIAFDEKLSISFLEQEIYGKSIIKGLVFNEPNFFDEVNLNDALKKKYPAITHKIKLEKLQNVWVFDTYGAYFEDSEWVELHSTGCENGTRLLNVNKKEHIKSLIIKNAEFLHNEIKDDGKFIYGYFPAYNREIKSYNTVRHCTAIYALLETLEVDDNRQYLEKINLAIQYSIDHFYKEVDGAGFMIDNVEDKPEIKLGSNATAIFMFAKYQEITKDSQYQKYAEKLAEGILKMVDSNGETTHVIDYPSLEVKEKFRIVYYDGEAALGLLRLFQINNDTKLLDKVKLMFEHFITKKYDKYHDHWLSYCTNELTKLCPEEKYFQFGINNYLKHMDFIGDRKTAYATFLEMMMSAYKMIVRMKALGMNELYEKAKFEELKKLIELRVQFQRATGYFYPEVAMYMGKPEKIINSFYVRHDRFRTRIDDQEHNLSGYVAYYNFFIEN